MVEHARMEEVEVTISPQGEVTLAVRGAQGASCLDLTRDLEARLGTVEDRQHTADYYQSQHQHDQQWNQGG